MSDTPLDMLAARINRRFKQLEHAGPKYDDQRISVGLLLIAAREGVQSGKWHDWLKANIERSIRDCQKAIALAHALDPHQTLAEQRQRNRQYTRRHRQSLRRRVRVILVLAILGGTVTFVSAGLIVQPVHT